MEKYKELKNSVSTEIKKVKQVFYAKNISGSLPPLNFTELPCYLPCEPPPEITHDQVYNELKKLKVSKSGHPNDLPIGLIKEFAFEIAIPLTTIFNKCIQEGVFPTVWKTAAIIPVS